MMTEFRENSNSSEVAVNASTKQEFDEVISTHFQFIVSRGADVNLTARI